PVMSRSRIILLLVASHALVFVAAWYYVAPADRGSFGVPAFLARSYPQSAPVPAAPAAVKPAPAAAPPITVFKTNRFHWSQVESANYRKYIANLRAIGCPEETIRDIITADVNKLFADRKKALGASGSKTNKFEYWKPGMQMFTQMFDEEKIKKQQELAKEKRALLTELLGVAPEEKADLTAMMGGGADMMDQMLDFLPPAKQTAAMEIEQKFAAKLMKSVGNVGGGDLDGLKDMQKVQKEKEAELAKVLSPQELEDYNLRMSQTAMMMRFQLASFDPNEQEFRDLFKAKKQFDDQFGMLGVPPTDKAEKEKYDAATKAMNEQLKQTLGDRYPDYERSQDYVYQALYAVAQRNDLSPEVTRQVYDLKKPAEAEAKRVRADKSLSTEQRDAALQGIRAETERSARAALGDKAFDSYQKNPGGYWMKQLNP
ncbi:MAG: hypothetical protein ACREDG_05430, partial [Methylocella sp.]